MATHYTHTSVYARLNRKPHELKKNPLDNHAAIHNHMVVDTLSTAFAALSDPTRRAILFRLTQGPATVKQIAGLFPISQQAVSKHLAYLESARLIAKSSRGRRHFCTLEPRTLQNVADWAEGYREFWEASHERLDDLLEKMKAARTTRPKKHPRPNLQSEKATVKTKRRPQS